jgi:hypothetical protein
MQTAASPSTKIYAIDPLEQPICGQKERWMDSVNAEYFTGKNFQDFGAIDCQKKINIGEIDPNKTLVFLGDHLKVYDHFPTLMKQVWVLSRTLGRQLQSARRCHER